MSSQRYSSLKRLFHKLPFYEKTLRLLISRARLVVALILGILVGWYTPLEFHLVSKILIGWNSGVYIYLILLWILMVRSEHHHIHKIAARQDENALIILGLLCVAAIMSLVAIVWELSNIQLLSNSLKAPHLILTGLTLLGTWVLIPTIFAMHYAHQYYLNQSSTATLQFPDRDLEPNYWDFLYFSFTISVASQTADIAIGTRSMRKTVLAQAVLSFIFNTSILALAINLSASLLN